MLSLDFLLLDDCKSMHFDLFMLCFCCVLGLVSWVTNVCLGFLGCMVAGFDFEYSWMYMCVYMCVYAGFWCLILGLSLELI